MAKHIHVHIHGTADSWEEGKHPRTSNGEFGSGSGKGTSGLAKKIEAAQGAKLSVFNVEHTSKEGEEHVTKVEAVSKIHAEMKFQQHNKEGHTINWIGEHKAAAKTEPGAPSVAVAAPLTLEMLKPGMKVTWQGIKGYKVERVGAARVYIGKGQNMLAVEKDKLGQLTAA